MERHTIFLERGGVPNGMKILKIAPSPPASNNYEYFVHPAPKPNVQQYVFQLYK